MYGNQIEASRVRSFIGDVEVTGVGHVLLRVGRENYRGKADGWHQTEHVVLKQDEALDFMREISDKIGLGVEFFTR